MLTTETEAALVRKLLETGHLSVPERQELPGGAARLSVIDAVISLRLRESGVFPPGRRLSDIFDGALIQQSEGGQLVVFRKTEASYMRFELCGEARFASVGKAVQQYLAWAYRDARAIDGVPIAWNS